jgi:effector-binding domain-containing protein
VILLIEPDRVKSKKLCDMLHKERIIVVQSKQAVLEALVQHRDKLDVIVANVRLIHEILSADVIAKLCDKLSIELPPVVGLYNENEKELAKGISLDKNKFKLVEYNGKDLNFPVRYIKAIKTVHSNLSFDMNKANEVWLKTEDTQDLIDIRQWLEKEGFETAPRKEVALEKKKRAEKKIEAKEVDYKKLYTEFRGKYLELKEKYDELLEYIEDLTDFS